MPIIENVHVLLSIILSYNYITENSKFRIFFHLSNPCLKSLYSIMLRSVISRRVRHTRAPGDAVHRTKLTTTEPGSDHSLAMQMYGDPDAPKTVVFLHGIMGNKRNWRNPSLIFVKANPAVRCITIDLRGHGDSQYFPGPNTVQNCAEDLHDTFQKFNIQPTILSAHSFGGKVALK